MTLSSSAGVALEDGAGLHPRWSPLKEGYSLADPRRSGYLKEFLGTFPSGQAQPERTSFSLQTQIDVDEGTASPLLDRPFDQ